MSFSMRYLQFLDFFFELASDFFNIRKKTIIFYDFLILVTFNTISSYFFYVSCQFCCFHENKNTLAMFYLVRANFKHLDYFYIQRHLMNSLMRIFAVFVSNGFFFSFFMVFGKFQTVSKI